MSNPDDNEELRVTPEVHRLLHVIDDLTRSCTCYCFDDDYGRNRCAVCCGEDVLREYQYVGCGSCPYSE